MKRNISTAQSGYALILMVLALMGVGGVVLAGFTQGVKVQSEHERYLHNQRVLREAKQALLQYAYNYPVTAGNGPGRLPCPDTDSDGIPNATAFCGGANGIVGRFPWAEDEMNFYEARDASGETLWYAVSNQFANSGSLTINSATLGTINIEDRSGAPIHDATTGGGVAAVIIAPGSAIDRNGVIQDRAADPEDPENYLDLFGAVDNADFVNLTANGFVTGPIEDVVGGDILVNDQMIVITAAEVIAMAEQATLQAYRDTILDYLDQVACTGETPEGSGINETLCLANGGSWDPVYPWLYNYNGVSNVADLSSYYPANANFATELADNIGNYGRIPSIFTEYFSEADSQPIETELIESITVIDPLIPDTVALTEVTCDNRCGTGGPRTFSHDPDPDVEPPTLNIQFTQILTAVGFVDIDPGTVADEVRLTATLPVAESVPFELFFLGAHNDPNTNWTACPGGANDISDCFFASGSDRSILRLSGTIDFDDVDSIDVVLNYDFDIDGVTPAIARTSADGASHAWITGTYPISAVVSLPGVFSTVTYEFDGHWHAGNTMIDDGDYDEDYSTGTLDIGDFTRTSLTLGLRFFPDLPAWAFDNGWHDSIRMAYADDYRPDTLSACNVTPDDDCLKTTDLADPERRNKISLLVIAGEHDWTDDNDPGLQDDLSDVFDAGNTGDDPVFLAHEGNDKILIIEELP